MPIKSKKKKKIKSKAKSCKKMTGGSGLSDGIIKISEIIENVSSKLKNTPVVISNGRFSTLGLQEEEANSLHKILKKTFPNAKKEIYSTGGFKIYFDDKKLHNKMNKKIELLGGGFGFRRTSDSKSDNIFSIINSYPTKTELPRCKTLQGGKRKSIKKRRLKKKGGGISKVPMPLRFLNYYN